MANKKHEWQMTNKPANGNNNKPDENSPLRSHSSWFWVWCGLILKVTKSGLPFFFFCEKKQLVTQNQKSELTTLLCGHWRAQVGGLGRTCSQLYRNSKCSVRGWPWGVLWRTRIVVRMMRFLVFGYFVWSCNELQSIFGYFVSEKNSLSSDSWQEIKLLVW